MGFNRDISFTMEIMVEEKMNETNNGGNSNDNGANQRSGEQGSSITISVAQSKETPTKRTREEGVVTKAQNHK